MDQIGRCLGLVISETYVDTQGRHLENLCQENVDGNLTNLGNTASDGIKLWRYQSFKVAWTRRHTLAVGRKVRQQSL